MQVSGLKGRQDSFSQFDFSCMKRAFTLARRGRGKTSPNPMVGAVLVKDGRVIGEGWHRRYGGAHAEAEAIKAALAAGFSPGGADLYCTLEPCCFNAPDKQQPPCTGLVINSGLKNVYIANLDPNPKVSGKGLALLEEAGIKVKAGLWPDEGEELNRAFFTFQRRGRPFVHLKAAQSLDGRIAAPDGSARWISDETARRLVHRLRSEYDAVLIGRGTALADDPELTVRLVKGRNPHRVILDSGLNLPETAKLFALKDTAKTLIFHSHDADTGKAAKLRFLGAELIPIQMASGGIPLREVLAALAKRGIQSVLVEGGAGIFRSFLMEGLWDRLSVFIAPLILGGGVNFVSGLGFGSMTEALRFKNASFRRTGSQALFEVNNEQLK
jgi:diaminohydroxyphosphoribosylaminopyrimidine deaminase/5-amino-6-(5-phosphoribosylamino)uracil reductase